MNTALAHPLYIALKASLAALLALSVVEWVGLPDKLSATFVAVVCISPTVYSGVRRGLEQLGASALGGAVTWALASVLPHPLRMGAALFVAIWLSFAVGLPRGAWVAAFTVLYVLILPGQSAAVAAEVRLASLGIGVGSAILLNLVVSALWWRRVFTRRLAIARGSVAAQWRALSGALLDEVGEADRRALFEESFGLLRALFEELEDAEREGRWLSGGQRGALEHALAAAHQLLAVAHHGKEVALRLEDATGRCPLASARAAELSRSLAAATQLPNAGELEPAVQGAFSSASLAWERARAAEQRFLQGRLSRRKSTGG